MVLGAVIPPPSTETQILQVTNLFYKALISRHSLTHSKPCGFAASFNTPTRQSLLAGKRQVLFKITFRNTLKRDRKCFKTRLKTFIRCSECWMCRDSIDTVVPNGLSHPAVHLPHVQRSRSLSKSWTATFWRRRQTVSLILWSGGDFTDLIFHVWVVWQRNTYASLPQVPNLRGHSALGAMWWYVTGQPKARNSQHAGIPGTEPLKKVPVKMCWYCW